MAPQRNSTPTLHHYLRQIGRSTSGPAGDRLAVENLGLVVTIARRYWFDAVTFDDLVQAGNLGLLRATRSYDPTRGVQLATWISFGIRQAILDHLARNQHALALPRSVHQHFARTGRLTVGAATAAASETARLEAIPPADAGDDRRATDGPSRHATLLPPQDDEAPSAAEATLLAAEIDDLLGVLDVASRRLVAERFGLDGHSPRGTMTQAAERGISREAVRLRFVRAMDRLATEARRRGLDDWLDD